MFNTIFSLCIYFIFLLIFFVGAKLSPCNDANHFIKRLNSFRGIMALEIVLGHCVRYESTILSPLGNFMLIGVGYFFFISGFGLAYSFHSKPAYIRTFLRHRLLKLIIIIIIGLIVTTSIALLSPYDTALASLPTTPMSVIKESIVRTNWYLRELFCLYLLFYIIYRFVHKYKDFYILLLTIILCIVLYILGYTRCWYASSICFPLGLIFYNNYNYLIKKLDAISGYILSFSLVIIGLSELLWGNHLNSLTFQQSEGLIAISNNVLCVGFLLLLVFFSLHIEIGNKINKSLTQLSTEMYITQFVLVVQAEAMQLTVPIKIIFVLTIDIVIATLVHLLLSIKKIHK